VVIEKLPHRLVSSHDGRHLDIDRLDSSKGKHGSWVECQRRLYQCLVFRPTMLSVALRCRTAAAWFQSTSLLTNIYRNSIRHRFCLVSGSLVKWNNHPPPRLFYCPAAFHFHYPFHSSSRSHFMTCALRTPTTPNFNLYKIIDTQGLLQPFRLETPKHMSFYSSSLYYS